MIQKISFYFILKILFINFVLWGHCLSALGETELWRPDKDVDKYMHLFQDPSEFLKLNRGHPQCLFPARFRYLKKHLNLSVPLVNCPALNEWRLKLRSQEVAVVFASQFVSNPASVMGHTFLRFVDKNLESFLHTSVGYAADVPEKDGPFSYIYKGLTGKYSGHFFQHPYYEKVHEYNNMEQRDLWEFHLNLSADEKDMLIDLIWELIQNHHFSYYFFKENCSYIILELIEAVRSGGRLTENFGPYVAPYMTLQRLKEKGLIKEIRFRPSVRTEFISRYNSLSQKEKSQVKETIHELKLSESSSAEYLETMANYVLYRKNLKEGKIEEEWKNLYHEVLKRRSLIAQPVELKVRRPSSPLQSHRPHFIDYSIGNLQRTGLNQTFAFRPGIHKVMDKPNGFLKHSSFSFLETELRHIAQTGGFEFSRYTLFDMQNINTFYVVDPKVSWKFKAQGQKRGLLCKDCFLHEIHFQFGSSFDIAGLDLNLMAGAREMLGHDLNNGHLPLASGEIEFLKDFKQTKLRLSHMISSGSETTLFESRFEARLFEVLSHVHLGSNFHHQYLAEGNKNYFAYSLVSSYDF